MRDVEEREMEQKAETEGFFIADGEESEVAILNAAFRRAGIVREMFANGWDVSSHHLNSGMRRESVCVGSSTDCETTSGGPGTSRERSTTSDTCGTISARSSGERNGCGGRVPNGRSR